jgi:hypothetical protein
VDRRTVHGESWQWREFKVTAYHLPGQTLYHGGLLVEGRGHRILFAGDSFTPSGIDDYCAANRNWLGRAVGFDACLELVERLQPDMILNCHVDVAFCFTAQECALMRANLAERERSYGELLAWDHPNYGMDEGWVRCHPYEQRVCPGERVLVEVVVTNHSSEAREAECRLVLPSGWGICVPPGRAAIGPRDEGRIALSLDLPPDLPPARWVVPVGVIYDGRRLGQIQEAILDSRVTV